jgi:hypothetical protein
MFLIGRCITNIACYPVQSVGFRTERWSLSMVIFTEGQTHQFHARAGGVNTCFIDLYNPQNRDCPN